MSYYSIVCPRCLKKWRNEDMVFKFQDEHLSADDQLSHHHTAPRPMQSGMAGVDPFGIIPAQYDAGATGVDPFGIIPAQHNPGATGTTMMDGFTIRNYTETKMISSLTEEYAHVDVDVVHEQEANPGELLVGVRYVKEGSGETFTNNKRYCPNCGQLHPAQSGRMPTYAFPLIGTSNAGKTVFLTVLNRYLGDAAQVVELTPSSRFRMTAVRTKTSDVFEKLSSELFDGRGVLPAVTVGFEQEPYMCQGTLRLGDKKKDCLIILRDMMGEAVTGDSLYEHAEICARANGILMIIDSEALRCVITKQLRAITDQAVYDDALEATRLHADAISSMRENLQTKLCSITHDMSAFVLLSKCDVLWHRHNDLEIPPFEPAIIERLNGARYDRNYFLKLGNSTKNIMSKLDREMYTYLAGELVATTPQFMTGSALGYHVTIELGADGMGNKVRRVTQPLAINPVRLYDPFIYLLMKVGFLPPLHEMVLDLGALNGQEQRRVAQQNKEKFIEWQRLHWQYVSK